MDLAGFAAGRPTRPAAPAGSTHRRGQDLAGGLALDIRTASAQCRSSADPASAPLFFCKPSGVTTIPAAGAALPSIRRVGSRSKPFRYLNPMELPFVESCLALWATGMADSAFLFGASGASGMAECADPVWRFGPPWNGGLRHRRLAFWATRKRRRLPALRSGACGRSPPLASRSRARPADAPACGGRCGVSLCGGIPCDQRSSMRPVAASRVRALRRLFAPTGHRRWPETFDRQVNQPSAWGVPGNLTAAPSHAPTCIGATGTGPPSRCR